MKFFSSFVKELKIASRGFYFYIEIFMAVLILLIFLFFVPDQFQTKGTEYIYLDMPIESRELFMDEISENDLDGKVEDVTVKIDKVEKPAFLFSTKDKEIYLLTSREDAVYMAETERKMSAVIEMDDQNQLKYEYFLQGYESNRFKNLLSILHVESSEFIQTTMQNQEVRPLSTDHQLLSDKENMIPTILVFNGSLMGLFIIAAYIFLDRQEGVIKAYAVTPSPVWHYLMSKVAVIILTSFISSLIVLIPIMGLQPDYILLTILLLATGFFSSSLGLLIASFYENIMQAFGTIYVVMMLMIIPNIAYFLPSWNPNFIKFIPTYLMLEGFKSILLDTPDTKYILLISGGFLLTGFLLFFFSNRRYKKTLAG